MSDKLAQHRNNGFKVKPRLVSPLGSWDIPVTKPKVEKGVPVPKINQPKKYKYPWGEMEVGDSFFVKDGVSTKMNCTWNGRQLGRKFIARTVDGGCRVWRIA